MSSFADNTPHESSPTAKAARDAAIKAAKASWSAAHPFPIASDPSLLGVALAAALRADSIVDAALGLARYGVPVFPVSPDDKKPLNAHGIYRATTDPAEVEHDFPRRPDALIAVPMGHRTGLFAVDDDASPPHAHDGIGAWSELETKNGETTIWVHSTPSGGNYDKLDLTFDDGTKLSLNNTNGRAIARAWGYEGGDWIDEQVELSVGLTTYKGEQQESILVKPISPPIPLSGRKALKPVKPTRKSDPLDDDPPF